MVYTICYQMVRDHHEAQNLAQETFLSAFRHIDGCPPDSYKPWLARIASNKAKDFLKSAYARRVNVCGEDELRLLPARDAPDEAYLAKETRQTVCGCIEALKEPYRMVCQLYFLEEKNAEEISSLLGRPIKTVQTQLYRARGLLKEQLKEERGA